MTTTNRPNKRAARPLDGQVALVTGGGKGLGRAIALALSARGVRVVLTGRNERALGEVVGEIANAGGKARHLAGDVRDPAHLAAAVERAVTVFGGLHIAVANASAATGALPLGGAGEGGLTQVRDVLETNLLGAYQTFDAAARAMQGPGRLIAVSRVVAPQGASRHSAYAASNAGLLGLVRAAAEELAPRGITANAILPRWADADAAEELPPEQVAELCVFLCSSAADGITGQSLAMSGATSFGA
jgi:3-oxoacyl-[acyl-carrier protein] reductase